jgi:membrane peptidoglycan carboxypeptidase
VQEATDRSGNVVYSAPNKHYRAYSQDMAADMTYALQQPFQRGTAAGLAPGRPAAGKTGTTDSNKSAWLCGYTPQLAAAVALFRDGNKPLNGILGINEVTGGTLPGRVWAAFIQEALQGQPVIPFPQPTFSGTRQGSAPAPLPAPLPTRPNYNTTRPLPAPTLQPSPSASSRPTLPSSRPSPQPSGVVTVPSGGGGGARGRGR